MEEISGTPNAEAAAATPTAPDLSAPFTPELANEPAAAPRKGRSKLFYILAGVFGTIGVVALLCIGLAATAGFLAWQAMGEVQPVLTEFMQNLADGDADAAYAMMSAAGQRQITRAELADFTTGSGRE